MTGSSKKGLGSMALIFLGVFAIGILGVYLSQQHATQTASAITKRVTIDGTLFPKARDISAFTLQTTDGKSLSAESLKGHWTFMFFGFTNCAFVCPTTLTETNKMMQDFSSAVPKADIPRIVFVSVDPARDSLPRLKNYLKQFNPNFIGARTDDIKQLNLLAKQMNVSFSKIMSSDGDPQHYSVTHSAQMIVIGPDAKVHAYLSYPHRGQEMAQDFSSILKALPNLA